ncbi:MAG: hypothetical protein JF606_12380 [Burkholderiales bacterium]|nr:hypothetical protein [Burkholderiales bacterium]
MPIDDQERARRKLEFEFSRERARGKGILLTKETEALAERYISGEFTKEQFVEAGLKLYLPQIRPH